MESPVVSDTVYPPTGTTDKTTAVNNNAFSDAFGPGAVCPAIFGRPLSSSRILYRIQVVRPETKTRINRRFIDELVVPRTVR